MIGPGDPPRSATLGVAAARCGVIDYMGNAFACPILVMLKTFKKVLEPN